MSHGRAEWEIQQAGCCVHSVANVPMYSWKMAGSAGKFGLRQVRPSVPTQRPEQAETKGV